MVDIIVGDEQWMKLGEDGTQLNELDELDLGDWNPMMADAAAFLKKKTTKQIPVRCRSSTPPSQTTFATSGCPRQKSNSLCWL